MSINTITWDFFKPRQILINLFVFCLGDDAF